MTQKFTRKDVENVFKQYLAAQGYKLDSMNVEVAYSEFSCINCTVTQSTPTKTFIIPIGHITEQEAKKNLQQMMKLYREEITITEDKESTNYLLPNPTNSEQEKSNEN